MLLRFGLPPGGIKLSKFSLRLASIAARGVLGNPGVRLPTNAPCAGLGVTFTKSAKLNCWLGVLNPPTPGVDIMAEGATCLFEGGVDGANTRADLTPGFAGDGDVARYRSKSAPSSPAALLLRWRAARLLVGGGVRGGEDRYADDLIRYGRADKCASSSSETWPKGGDSGTVDTFDTKDRFGP